MAASYYISIWANSCTRYQHPPLNHRPFISNIRIRPPRSDKRGKNQNLNCVVHSQRHQELNHRNQWTRGKWSRSSCRPNSPISPTLWREMLQVRCICVFEREKCVKAINFQHDDAAISATVALPYPIMMATQTVIGTVMACGSFFISISISESFSHEVMLPLSVAPLSLCKEMKKL